MQRRSQQTVAAILEATARILVEDGFKGLNTNRVAEVAGVSIGSLYQYFPNKEALVLALAEQHLAKQIDVLSGMSRELRELPLSQSIRQCIRALIEATMVDAELHRAFVTDVVHLGEPLLRKLHQQAEDAVRIALERRREEILPENLELAAFFLVSSVDSVILRSLTLASDRFELPSLEEELYALVLRYLTGESVPS
jgi:AcrR family transcriptional regulator